MANKIYKDKDGAILIVEVKRLRVTKFPTHWNTTVHDFKTVEELDKFLEGAKEI